MKYSFYNFVFRNGDTSAIYNTFTDNVLLLKAELADMIKEYRDDIGRIESRHPDLFAAMTEKGMIVPDDCDEVEHTISYYRKQENDQSYATLTILPTMNCNLRCWYCYEEHKPHSNMSAEVLEHLFRYIEKQTGDGVLKRLRLDLFGGEPLIPFQKVVLPLLRFAKEVCHKNGVRLHVHITTNGVLLTEKVLEEIIAVGLNPKPTFQITLDGNREMHNKSKHLATGGPTFDRVIHNIKNVLKAGMFVTNRFNYTYETVDSFIDIMEEYRDLTDEEKGLLHFDFQQVWQESHLEEVRGKALRLADTFRKESFNVNVEKRFNRDWCPEESDRSLSVNYDGLVYKCTARDMTKDNADGVLTEDGDISWNERFMKRKELQFGNQFCQHCKIYPICHGCCAQFKFEHEGKEDCYFDYTEAQKTGIVLGRLEYILNQNAQHQQET